MHTYQDTCLSLASGTFYLRPERIQDDLGDPIEARACLRVCLCVRACVCEPVCMFVCVLVVPVQVSEHYSLHSGWQD